LFTPKIFSFLAGIYIIYRERIFKEWVLYVPRGTAYKDRTAACWDTWAVAADAADAADERVQRLLCYIN